ncbi:MAG: YbaB/EbfC family nucleoid-associated protein [Deferribacteres bacterium]|nr:YbaB/EbfC family nucleoid-associated protein [Deferribacteres bacterium]
MKDLFSLLRDFQKVKAKVNDMKEELRDKVVEGISGGGMVKVRVNGAQEVLSLEIEDEVLEMGKDVLEDLVVAAVNDGLRKSKEMAEEELKKLIQSMGVPVPPDLL